MSRLNIVN